DPRDLARVERLGDRERAVPEIRLRGEQLELDELACERTEGEQRLETGHASPGDEDAKRPGCTRTRRMRHWPGGPAGPPDGHPFRHGSGLPETRSRGTIAVSAS